MILTVDVGNSNITMGVYKEDELLFVARLATERARTGDQYAVELKAIFALYDVVPRDFEGAIISSVVPELTAAVRSAVQMVTGHAPLLIGPGLKTGLNIRTDTPGILGADLVVGAVAAIHSYELPCLVMDLGTATKISVLDEQGTYLGCTISAGVGISLDALATRTSQLPHISIEAPDHVIGTNSPDCMQSGTVFGTAAMLDGLCDRIEEELGRPVKTIVATGGLAKDIVSNCKRNVLYSENLLLEGLKLVYEKNMSKKDRAAKR